MARRPIKEHPLPEWFDLTKYNELLGVKNEAIIREVTERTYSLSCDGCTDGYLNGAMQALKEGQILLSPIEPIEPDDEDTPRMRHSEIVSIGPGPFEVKIAQLPEPVPWEDDIPPLRGGAGVMPIDTFTLAGMYGDAKTAGLIKPAPDNPDEFTWIKTDSMLASVSALLELNSLAVSVFLAEATDEEIIHDFKELLPIWRDRMGMPEPVKKGAGQVGPFTIKRIIEYAVIPMLDLMLWAKSEGFEYSAEQLSRVLFPEAFVSGKHLTDTRIPFALGFANHDYQDMVSLWLKQTGRDGKQNGERLVRDEWL